MVRDLNITQTQIDEALQTLQGGNGKIILQLGGQTARTEDELNNVVFSLARAGRIQGVDAAQVESWIQGLGVKNFRDRMFDRLRDYIEEKADAGLETDDAAPHTVETAVAPVVEEVNPEERAAQEKMGDLLRQMVENPDSIIILLPGQGMEVIGSPLTLDLSGMDTDEVQALDEALRNWDGDLVHPLIAMTQVTDRVVEWGERGTPEEHLVRDVYLGPWRTPTAEDGERVEMEGEPGEGIQEQTPGEQLPPARGPISDAIEDALPKDFPGRRPLEQAGYTTLAAVRPLSLVNLIDLPGIGDATAKQIIERVAASLEKAATEGAI
jgi:hypothetical protein